MSVRAYKIITKEIESEPSFNLWSNGSLLNYFEDNRDYASDDLGYDNKIDGEGGTISITVGLIKKAVKDDKLWEKDDLVDSSDWIIPQFEKDIKGFRDDEWIEYECY